MTLPGNSSVGARSSWRSLLVVLAIGFLTVNVVTRYSVAGYEISSVRTARVVKSPSQQSQRQRLLSNALQWISPAPASTLFQPARIVVRPVSAVFLAINLDSESWLYNRPPPSC